MLKHVFITDEFETLIPNHDTSLALMREALVLGHTIYQAEISNVSIQENNIYIECKEIELGQDNISQVKSGNNITINLSQLDNELRIWMRKDPPVNREYIEACQLLQASPNIVLNNPYNIISHNEKLMTLQFPELIPQTFITNNIQEIKDILNNKLLKAVAKPVDGFGGKGIFILEKGMNNLSSILESITDNGTQRIILQEYLPEAQVGDKRIYLLNGEILGAVLRVPSPDNHQANLAYGGKAQATDITARDKYICDSLKDFLKEKEFYLTGIDVIGEKLTEINVTCPTCIEEISHFSRENKAREIIKWSESYFPML